MDTWKILLIVVLVIVAAWTLYPPDKTLKSGIDLAGGTSLVYEIDTHGYEAGEIKGLSQKMITVLRRRIDPANIQNLIWRPQGNTRFEIQMPLANAETRQKRDNYKKALKELFQSHSLLDKAAERGLLKKNYSDRKKSRLTRAFNSLSGEAKTAEKTAE